MSEKIIDRVFQYLNSQSIPHTRFEKEIGLSNGYLTQMRKKHSDLGESVIRKIIDHNLHLNMEWLLKGEGKMLDDGNIIQVNEPVQEYIRRTDSRIENQNVPLFNMEAAAGLVQFFNEQHHDVLGYIQFPNIPKCDGAIHITGDSMYPLLKSGDIVLYQEIHDIKNGIFHGEMYLLAIQLDGDYMTVVKFLHESDKGPDYVKLVSHNKHHSPKTIPLKSIKALAFIKASIRINSMA